MLAENVWVLAADGSAAAFKLYVLLLPFWFVFICVDNVELIT